MNFSDRLFNKYSPAVFDLVVNEGKFFFTDIADA